MFDWNSEFLLELHSELKERYSPFGLFVNSESPDFVECIVRNARFHSKRHLYYAPIVSNEHDDH